MTSNESRAVTDALAPTETCLPLERFEGPLTAAEQTHVAGCPRCQAEAALFSSAFEGASDPDADEDAAVSAIVSDLQRRRDRTATAVVPAPARTSAVWRGWLAAAAVAVLGLSGAYLALRTGTGTPSDPAATGTYRTAAVMIVEPAGDVPSAPAALHWQFVPGARRYAIEVSEVDGTVLWRGTSTSASVALPPDVTARFAPAKPIDWKVTAFDDAGRVVGESPVQRFRVAMPRP